jgi:hypothetical protein
MAFALVAGALGEERREALVRLCGSGRAYHAFLHASGPDCQTESRAQNGIMSAFVV